MVTIAEHACNHVLKEGFKAVNISFAKFLDEYEHCNHLQLCEDQDIPGKLKRHVCNHMFAILSTYIETRLYFYDFNY